MEWARNGRHPCPGVESAEQVVARCKRLIALCQKLLGQEGENRALLR